MYFDTHAHYYDKRFDEDRDALLSAMPEAGITRIVNVSAELNSIKKSLELADNYPFIYNSFGIHPHNSKAMDDGTILTLEKPLQHRKSVAVGEIGLDYHYDFSPRDVQQKRFREQLELARQIKKPVIIHEREALQDTLAIIREFRDLCCVVHCFSGSWETAKIILDMGWYLSFTGIVTFKNARKSLEVVEKMPSDRIMIETDCPYLAPEPVRGNRNSSLYLPHIAQKIAEVRGLSLDEAAALTMENGLRFFAMS